MEIKHKFFDCECHTECIELQPEKEDKFIYFSIYKFGGKDRKTPFFTKIKYIWKIIKTGNPYEDQIVLSNQTAKEMAEYILEEIK